jgi:antitoxin YefM
MTKTLPISDVKTHLPELLTGVEEREEEVIVTRKGKPAAVLVNIREYERLKATVDVLSDGNLMDQVRRSRRYFARGGKGLTIDQVFGPERRKPRKTSK